MNENEKMVVKQDNIKKSCFVITPIGKETDSIRRHIDGIIEAVIEPVLKKTIMKCMFLIKCLCRVQ